MVPENIFDSLIEFVTWNYSESSIVNLKINLNILHQILYGIQNIFSNFLDELFEWTFWMNLVNSLKIPYK